MRAVVLVGGFGTRLRPLTLDRPKQMLPIIGRPMIEPVIEHLAGHGIDDVVLSMGYKPDAFTAQYPTGEVAGVRLHFAVEPEPLDTAGAIRFAALDAGIDERFVVMNADCLTDIDVSALVAFHDARGAEGTIALHKVTDPSAFGVVPTDADGKVEAFVEKPPADEAPTDLINAGIYVLEPSVLDRIAPDRRVSIEREVFPAMVEAGTLYAAADDAYWIDAGTPALYIRAQLDMVDGHRGAPVEGVDPQASIDPAAEVAHSVVGAGCVVGAGAVVRDSVLLPGSTVADGSVVERTVLAFRAQVGAGAALTDCVIGDDEVVPDGTRLDDVRQPAPD
ncbi:NDP-sugar synthase [Iamia sp. SCSIO 61187]|uniref:sugar phosphate nucleotidyltransferase n=1 Tax=Iamia sp. SCSIO 61187 TaxID=2722752 RepID=UPI001C626876|nr:NDP-sugar synthase [Iamia sp. SCSIO 61187]QYG92457.1 NDP-sugar synthase [Iamia sp. SCSIO 61187]